MQLCPTLIKTGSTTFTFFSSGAYALPGKGHMRYTHRPLQLSVTDAPSTLLSTQAPTIFGYRYPILDKSAPWSYFIDSSLRRLMPTFRALPHIRETHVKLLQGPGCHFSLRNTEKTPSEGNFFHSLDACLYPLMS